MSLAVIIYNEITNINAWHSSLLDVILCTTGNSLYTCINNYNNKTISLLTDAPEL